jgi:hypothetical protein
VGDPVASGIVPRLNQPGGNITGFATYEATLGGKWLELLSEIAPGLKRAAIMFNPDTAPVSAYMPSFESAARSLKVMAITAPVHSDVEIETAIIALGREPGGGLVVMPDGFTGLHYGPIISAAARNNLPAVYWESAFARVGGLLSYGVDQVDAFRRAASYVDRILRGEKPGDLPVQFPTKFEMVACAWGPGGALCAERRRTCQFGHSGLGFLLQGLRGIEWVNFFAGLFLSTAQNSSGNWVQKVHPSAGCAFNPMIGVGILECLFRQRRLNRAAGDRADKNERSHGR